MPTLYKTAKSKFYCFINSKPGIYSLSHLNLSTSSFKCIS